jgi:6-phosphofructokinase 1
LDERFTQSVSYHLTKQPGVRSFCYADEKNSEAWTQQIGTALSECDAFVLLLGKETGKTQLEEARIARDLASVTERLLVKLGDDPPPPEFLFYSGGRYPIVVQDFNRDNFTQEQALKCAQEVIHQLRRVWVFDDDLPLGYPFDYEKKIIEEYEEGAGRLLGKRVEEGCPPEWPGVVKDHSSIRNPVDKQIIGARRKETAAIIVDTRTGWRSEQAEPGSRPVVRPLTFPEAGPRELLRYPVGNFLTVGIVVSGGIAPGINAVISSIVSRHRLYRDKAEEKGSPYNLAIRGYKEGLQGLLTPGNQPLDLLRQPVERWAEEGGSRLRTSRAEQLLHGDTLDRERNFQHIINRLIRADGVQILYIIGGDGSMKAAHAIWKMARDAAHGVPERSISVVGIPKTMDNDILWVWQSFGFLSAVEKAREVILNLHTEGTSNPRLGIIQLFGSDSGFVVSHAVLASGICDAALIPEVHFKMKMEGTHRGSSLCSVVERVLNDRHTLGESPHGLIVMAETAIPMDARDYIHDEQVRLSEKEKVAVEDFLRTRRVRGQTPDELRAAGLKIVSRTLQRHIRESMGTHDPYWKQFRVFTNEPRHLIRSVPPSVSDVVSGERLGVLAVDNAMAGYSDFMVSQWLTEYVLVPLKLVVLGRKRVPKNGIFWKSVLASTGQPPRMCDCQECQEAERIEMEADRIEIEAERIGIGRGAQ